jgi:hypothetical protein
VVRLLSGLYNLPDGVEGGEPLLNGVRCPGGLPVRISDAHCVRELILCPLDEKAEIEWQYRVRFAMKILAGLLMRLMED